MTSFAVALSDVAVIARGRKAYGGLDELGESLKQGQIHAIAVRPPAARDLTHEDYSGEPWVLVAGGRRMAAALKAGIKELRAESLGDMPARKAKELELEENLQRADMSFAEVLEMKLQLDELKRAEDPGWTKRDTARLIGEDKGNVSRDLTLAQAMRADPKLKAAPSKHAAFRQMEMTAHVKRLESTSSSSAGLVTGIRERLFTGDMREYLLEQKTHSVDLLFSDLPFGIEYDSTLIASQSSGSSYDDSKGTTLKLIRDIVPELIRVTKPIGWMVLMMQWENHFQLKEAIECFCTTHMDYGLPSLKLDSNGFSTVERPRRCSSSSDGRSCEFLVCEPIPWIWYRPNSQRVPNFPDLHAQNQYELICVINMGGARILNAGTGWVGNVLTFNAEYGGTRVHQMQKPPEFCEEVVRRCTLSSGRVLDVCFGSGSALRAAAKLGRDYGGCDLNPLNLEKAIGYIAGGLGVQLDPAIPSAEDPYGTGYDEPTGDDHTEEQSDEE